MEKLPKRYKVYTAVIHMNLRDAIGTTPTKVYFSRVKTVEGVAVRDHCWVLLTKELDSIRPHGTGKHIKAKRIEFIAKSYEYQGYDKFGNKTEMQVGLNGVKRVKVLGYFNPPKKPKKKTKRKVKSLPWDKLK